MRPGRFAYVRPSTIEELVGTLHEHADDVRILAGGQSLIPLMSLRLSRPELVVDLASTSGIDEFSVGAESATIGARVTHTSIERSSDLARVLPAAAVAARHIGHAAIRNRGTFVGSLAHGDPSAEWPALACALDARLWLESVRGERSIQARAFYQGPFMTAIEPDEVVTRVELPLPSRTHGWGFEEFARQSGAFAVVLVFALLELDEDERVTSLAICVGGAAPAPELLDTDHLIGSLARDVAVRDVAHDLVASLTPPSDIHASSSDRSRIAAALVERAMSHALSCTRAS